MSVSSSEFLLKKLFFRMELLLRGLMKAKIKESTKIGIYLYNNKMIVEAIFLILIGIFIGISQVKVHEISLLESVEVPSSTYF